MLHHFWVDTWPKLCLYLHLPAPGRWLCAGQGGIDPLEGTQRCHVGCAVPTCSSVIWKAAWKSKILTECGMTAWLSCSPLTTILQGAQEWGTGSTTSASRAGGRGGGLHAGTATKGLSPPGAGCGEMPAAALCCSWPTAFLGSETPKYLGRGGQRAVICIETHHRAQSRSLDTEASEDWSVPKPGFDPGAR